MKVTITKYIYKKELKMLTRHTLCYNFLKKINIYKKKIYTEEHTNRQKLTYALETSTLTEIENN
jgi:chromosome condensin MukBEF MukE localization factor